MRVRKAPTTTAAAGASHTRILLHSAALVLLLAAKAVAQPVRPASPPGPAALTGAPRFEDFPAVTGRAARSAPLILAARDLQYRTRLRAAAAERPNFAGHYVLTTWGCGTECLYGAVINLRTGRVTLLPFATCCLGEAPKGDEEMVSFRQDSTLLVLLGMRDQRRTDVGSHYYRIQGDRLIHQRSIPFPPRH